MRKVQQKSNQPVTEYDQPGKDHDNDQSEQELVPHQSMIRKSLGWTALTIVGFAILSGFFTTSYSDEGTPEEVVANRINTATEAGESLFEEEVNANIEARDFEVTNAGTDGGEARMLIWDFNKVDLDEVAVWVDGVPVKEKLILSENASAINIPVPSTVTIRG